MSCPTPRHLVEQTGACPQCGQPPELHALKVYVLETDCYESRGIRGVYATPEAAMAAWQPSPPAGLPAPGEQWIVHDVATNTTRTIERRRHTYQWRKVSEAYWSFDADWEDAADITEHEVQA